MISRDESMALLVAISTTLLGGCVASVPMASIVSDQEAKKFSTEPDKASIYVNCLGGTGNKLVWQVILDGRVAGSLASDTYLLLSVSPGAHAITVIFPGEVKQQTLNAESGRSYFYNTSVSMGWTSGILHFDPVDEKLAREQLKSSRRAQGVALTQQTNHVSILPSQP